MASKDKKPKAKTESILIEDIHDFFEENPELKLQDLDSLLLVKIIASALDMSIADNMGNPPDFIISNDLIMMEIQDKRFSIAIRDNNLNS